MIDIELYGGKRGLIQHAFARAQYALGVYADIRDIEWAAVRRLVFVCKGNICRSPYASVRARSLGIRAASFGLAACGGAVADAAASRNALLRGVDLSEHRSQKVESSSLADDDLIFVFEPAHLVEIRRIAKRRMVARLLGLLTHPVHPYIQDPYGRSDRYFQRCYSLIDANLTELIRRLVQHGAPVAVLNSSEKPRAAMVHEHPCNRTLG